MKVQLAPTEKHLIPGDERMPVAGHTNYARGVEAPDPFTARGPTTVGEYLWPVTFTRTRTRTRVGWAYQPPKEIGQAMAAMGGAR